MHVPCWRLPALHRAVRGQPRGDQMEVAPGYLAVLRQASARALSPPANGAEGRV